MVWMIAQIWANVYHFLMNDRPFDQFSHPKKKDDGKNYNDLEAQKQREAFKRKILSPESLFSWTKVMISFSVGESHLYQMICSSGVRFSY
jgi:hypothetical protein